MNLYRFTSGKYKDDLSGHGAYLFGGRWNSKGLAAVYTSGSVSLSLLEVIAHSIQYEDLKERYLMTVLVPDDAMVYKLNTLKLHAGWQYDIEYTRYTGDSFLREKKHLLLQVPSIVIKTEFNFIINPAHKDFRKVKLVSSNLFEFDSRLFK